jgi:hypothetical protein
MISQPGILLKTFLCQALHIDPAVASECPRQDHEDGSSSLLKA